MAAVLLVFGYSKAQDTLSNIGLRLADESPS